MERILCRKCGIEKPIEAFRRWTKSEGNGRPYRRRTCAECLRVEQAERHRKWRNLNRKILNEYSKLQRRRLLAEMGEEKRAAYLSRMAEVARNRRERLKAAAYLAYGGTQCVCCGEIEPMFLSIDHVNNDGAKHRKEVGTGERFWKWLADNHYPPGFQVLCMNCNHGKSRNGGICPHELEKVQRLERKLVGSSEPKRPALICE